MTLMECVIGIWGARAVRNSRHDNLSLMEGKSRGIIIIIIIIYHDFLPTPRRGRSSEVAAVGQNLRSISSQAGLQLLNVLVTTSEDN